MCTYIHLHSLKYHVFRLFSFFISLSGNQEPLNKCMQYYVLAVFIPISPKIHWTEVLSWIYVHFIDYLFATSKLHTFYQSLCNVYNIGFILIDNFYREILVVILHTLLDERGVIALQQLHMMQ